MTKFEVLQQNMGRTVGRVGLKVKKYSPEILVTAGIAGVIGGTVMACKSTLEAHHILDEHDEMIETIHEAESLGKEEYGEEQVKKDTVIVYTQTGVKFIKLYLPAISLTALGVGCILGAHNIMKKRNVAMLAAYKGVEQAYSDYRGRVIDELGVEKDDFFRHGIVKGKVDDVEVDEKTGKEKKVKRDAETMEDPNGISQYARFFDELNPNYEKNSEYNSLFLKCQQNYANDKLHARGHIFLNEVYEMLGMPHTQAGSIVGWVANGDGDNFVDFGLFDQDNPRVIDFINGRERAILLDFNVDGVIYDLIEARDGLDFEGTGNY